ncbi:MAG: FkbM family methyltransferase [Jannaschia helgolandensis]|uniref:Methyltransferase, FkbM family n=1 Tax=Jannaschia helgolandensis TaxID=188906 RepID=A0A1H7RUB2_9RHOB|nr:FkbM family methyltransferase [Jannaschia helgolandensis]SEL63755.1 methyltransferase, FkbM family [Jannaschia helgolandensis]
MIEYPVTRLQGAARRRHRRLRARIMRHLHKRSGEGLVSRANLLVRWLSGKERTFHYDSAAGLYSMRENGQEHWFSSPHRIWTTFDGLAARATDLRGQYVLDGVPFEEDDWIVDIGANIGDLSLCFRGLESGASMSVNFIAFEPSPKEFAALERNLAANPALASHECHNLALWSDDSEALTFYVKSEEADSSLIPITGATHKIKVPTARLDHVLPKRTYKLLKLEAEGVEPEILEGATEILPHFRFITADLGFERGTELDSTLPQVTNFLLQRGFEVVGYEGSRHVVLFRNTNPPPEA